MKSLLLAVIQKLASDLGLIRPSSKNTFELDAEVHQALRLIADREQRPENELAADLLSQAITRRQMAEAELERWRQLSRREQEVVALCCLGYSNYEVARRLSISQATVKSHIRSAIQKFGFQSKAELLRSLADWDFSMWDKSPPANSR